MKYRATLLILAATSALASEYHSGQAARAVLGQSSFSAHEPGFRIQSMAIAGSHLYAADSAQQILTFDLSKIPDLGADFSNRETGACGLCGFSPIEIRHEAVMPGISAVSHWGRSVAVVDTARHRVLLWRDSSSPRANGVPDVILGQSDEANSIGASTLVNPISVALDGKHVFVGDAALHRVLIWNSFPKTNNQPADEVLGQPDFTANNVSESAAADSIVLPSALVSDGLNLFVADPASERVLVFSPGDSPLDPQTLINSASLRSGPVTPGELITLNASGFSDVAASADSGVLPKRLGNTELIFDGRALPLLSVSPSQIQAQIPFDLDGATAASLYLRTEPAEGDVVVTTPLSVRVAPSSPGLFAFSGTEPRGGIVLHGSHSPVTDESPAAPGEVVTVWATGLGAILDGNGGISAVAGVPFIGPPESTALPVSARINGQDAPVLSAQLPKDSIGVYEVKILVPGGHQRFGRLSIAENGVASNVITFSLKPD